jgi:hypothetical protein
MPIKSLLLYLLIFSCGAKPHSYQDELSAKPDFKFYNPEEKSVNNDAVCIDSLAFNSKYQIFVESNGCFHHTENWITITRKSAGYFATFGIKGTVETAKVRQHQQTVQLTKTHLDSIRKFEKNLVKIAEKNYWCTTVDDYALTIGLKKSTYRVDDCAWNGFFHLVTFIFRN